MDKMMALIWLGICLIAAVSTNGIADATNPTTIDKRSAAPERLPEDYPDNLFDVKYDDYPVRFVLF